MKDVQETVKTAFDQSAFAAQQAFDVTNQAFKDSIDKSLGSLNDANALGKRNIEAIVASVSAATKGAETLGGQAMAFAKKSFEDHVAQTKALAGARSVQEVVELQTAFAKTALEGYIGELNRASEVVSSAVKDSLRPLNERATAMVEQFQSAR
jgi:phasin family protein